MLSQLYLCRGARVILGWLASGEQLGEERKERNERRGGRIGRRLGERPRELMIKIMMTTPVMRRRHRGRRSRRWWRGGGGVGGYLLLNERTPAVAVDDGREREAALVPESPLLMTGGSRIWRWIHRTPEP